MAALRRRLTRAMAEYKGAHAQYEEVILQVGRAAHAARSACAGVGVAGGQGCVGDQAGAKGHAWAGLASDRGGAVKGSNGWYACAG
jgi:hypothetical protein